MADVNFDVTTVSTSVSDRYRGGWGSSLVVDPHAPVVVMSLPAGRSPVPWATLNIADGTLSVSTGLDGELRAGIVDPDGSALLLTTHGLAEVEVRPAPKVVAVYRPKGLGKYLWRLLDLGEPYVAAAGWGTRSIAVVDRNTGEVRKRVRMVSPHAAIPLDGDVVRLFSFHGGEAVDLDVAELQAVGRTELPIGTNPILVGDTIFVLIGEKRPVPSADPSRVWRVEAKEIAAIDAMTLKIRQRAPAPPSARDILGVDDELLLISTDIGVVAVSSDDLKQRGRIRLAARGRTMWQHAFVPACPAIVSSDNRFAPSELRILRW